MAVLKPCRADTPKCIIRLVSIDRLGRESAKSKSLSLLPVVDQQLGNKAVLEGPYVIRFGWAEKW